MDELGSAGPLRGEPSQRKVPSIATRAAFKRAAPSLATSGAPTSMPRLARHLQLRRTVQPFVNLEQAHLLDVGRERSFPDEFGWALLHRLDALWNLELADRRDDLLVVGYGDGAGWDVRSTARSSAIAWLTRCPCWRCRRPR